MLFWMFPLFRPLRIAWGFIHMGVMYDCMYAKVLEITMDQAWWLLQTCSHIKKNMEICMDLHTSVHMRRVSNRIYFDNLAPLSFRLSEWHRLTVHTPSFPPDSCYLFGAPWHMIVWWWSDASQDICQFQPDICQTRTTFIPDIYYISDRYLW